MGKTLVAKAIIQAVDRFSGPMKRISRSAHMMGGAMGKASGKARRFGYSMQGAGSMGAGFAAYSYTRRIYEQQKALNELQATLDSTNKSFRPLEKMVISVAGANPKSITEISGGAKELAQAGVPLKGVINILRDVAKGSVATGESMSRIGGGVTDVIMSMQMADKGADITKEKFAEVSDVMAAAATSANQLYYDYLRGVSKVAPLAAFAGMSLIELTAALGVLADKGSKSSEGGTSMRTALLRIADTAPKAERAMKRMGLSMSDFMSQRKGFSLSATGVINSMSDLIDLKNYRKPLQKLLSNKELQKDADKMAKGIMNLISGSMSSTDAQSREKIAEGIRSTVRGGMKKVRLLDLLKAMEKSDKAGLGEYGALFGKKQAARMKALATGITSGAFNEKKHNIATKAPGAVDRRYKTMQKGAVGSIDRLNAVWDTFLRKLATAKEKGGWNVLDAISGSAERLISAIDSLAQSNPNFLKFATVGVLVAGVMAPLGFAISGVVAALSGIIALGAVISWPVVLGVAAIAGVIAYWSELKAFFSGMKEVFASFANETGLTKVFEGLKSIISAVSTALAPVVDYIRDLFGIKSEGNGLVSWFNAGKSAAKAILTPLRAIMKALRWIYDMASKTINWFGGSKPSASSVPKIAGARAGGGPVSANKTYLTGEKGIELFTPGRSGHITPNHRLGGGVVLHANVTFGDIIVNEAANGAEVARQAADHMREELQASLRGALSDTGIA